MFSKKNAKGFLMFLAVFMIIVVGFMGVIMVEVFIGATNSTVDFLKADKALYLAEAGLADAAHRFSLPSLSTRATCTGLNLSNTTLATGAYSVSSTGPFFASPTTLSGALTATATTIPVASTAAYQAYGRIMIDRELINYTGFNAANTAFTGITRGADGTNPVAHVSGTLVGQYQCNIISSGGSPSLTPSLLGGKRVIAQAQQLQEMWAVGNTAGLAYNFIRWNKPTESTWTNASLTSGIAQNLNSVSMLSYADGWAVGAARTFARWNGSNWVISNPTTVPNVIYQSVFCTAGNDCHAVGANSGGATIVHYDGAAWSRLTPTNTSTTGLFSVRCAAANNCWAVGDSTGARFYQYNGSTWAGVTQTLLLGYTYRGVFCNSATDCWAVGANNIFARLTSGTAWTNATAAQYGSIPSAQYNSIFCNASNDCWAVGNSNGGKNLYVHWNGTVWARDASSPTPVVNLNEVRCIDTKDCWAAGAVSGGQPVFNHWDGTSWTNVTVSGMQNAIIYGLSILIGPSTEPWGGWNEVNT